VGWIEPIDTIAAIRDIATEVSNSSDEIKRFVTRLIFQFKNGKAIVPVFGVGGVGKSTLGRLLVSENPLDIAAPYTESWLPEVYDFKGNVPGNLLVAPGQKERVARHWPKLIEEVVSGKSFGIINVVAYGYSSFNVPLREHDLFTPGIAPARFMEKYTDVIRREELKFLDTLVEGILESRKPMWMITVINKQDLWWHQRDAVRKHYERGAYAAKVLRLHKEFGEKSFQHEFIPASVALGNLSTKDGELLTPTSAGYDLSHHSRYMRTLFAKLDELLAYGRPDNG
jgi:hypothetical protein